MNETNTPFITVAAGIIYRQRQILAMQRPEGKPLAGYWEFPGGKAEEPEMPEQALVRELAEELGINVTAFRRFSIIRHFYKEIGFIVCLHFFMVERFSGEPRSLEQANLRWIDVAHARELDFLPPDLIILKKLEIEL